jgi:hypothetical protein
LRCRDARDQRGRESGSGKYSDHYTQLGRGLLEPLLAADPGYRGPRAALVAELAAITLTGSLAAARRPDISRLSQSEATRTTRPPRPT